LWHCYHICDGNIVLTRGQVLFSKVHFVLFLYIHSKFTYFHL
jgi:hypothetical protein